MVDKKKKDEPEEPEVKKETKQEAKKEKNGKHKNGNGNGLSKNAETLLKLLKKEDQSFAKVSVLLNVSKEHIADLAEGLSKIGYDVHAYIKDGEDYLTLARAEEIGLDAIPITTANRKIKLAFIADPRMGTYQSQNSMNHWLYKEVLEREGVDSVFLLGGLTYGKPTATLMPDVFKGDPKNAKPLIDYVVKHYPRSKNFKTYVVSGQRELRSKTEEGINLIKAITGARDDLSFAGDLERTLDVKGVRSKMMSTWDDN
jgi:biotin operon repressor